MILFYLHCTLLHYSLAYFNMEVLIILILTTFANAVSSTSLCPEGSRNCSSQQLNPKVMEPSLKRKERSTEAPNVKIHEKSCKKLKTFCSDNPAECKLTSTHYKDEVKKIRVAVRDAVNDFKQLNMSANPDWDNFLISQSGKFDVLKDHCSNKDLLQYYDNALWGGTFLMNKKVLKGKRKNNQLPWVHFNMDTVTYEFVEKDKWGEKAKDWSKEVLKSISDETCLKFEESPRKKPTTPNEYQFHILFLTKEYDSATKTTCGDLKFAIGSFDVDKHQRPIGIVIIPNCVRISNDDEAKRFIFRAVFNAFGQIFQPSEETRKEKIKHLTRDRSTAGYHPSYDQEVYSLALESYLFEYFSPDSNRMDVKTKYKTILDPELSLNDPTNEDYAALKNYFCKSCKSANGQKLKSLKATEGPEYVPFDRIKASCTKPEVGYPYLNKKCGGNNDSTSSDVTYCDGFSGQFGQLSLDHKRMVLGKNAAHCLNPAKGEVCTLPALGSSNMSGVAKIGYTSFATAKEPVKLYYRIYSCKPGYDLVGKGCATKLCESSKWTSKGVTDPAVCKSNQLSTPSHGGVSGNRFVSGQTVGNGISNGKIKGITEENSSPPEPVSTASRMTMENQAFVAILMIGAYFASE